MMATVPLLQNLGMSRQAASKHLAILETAGVIRSKPVGRLIYRELNTEAIDAASDWLCARTKTWERKLDDLQAYLEGLKH
jgi:DNA-binding transcriptional ArsR family regulator